jgi:hypothetical protein
MPRQAVGPQATPKNTQEMSLDRLNRAELTALAPATDDFLVTRQLALCYNGYVTTAPVPFSNFRVELPADGVLSLPGMGLSSADHGDT